MRRYIRRGSSAALAAAVLAAAVGPAWAAPIGDGVEPTCDEAYYATLDYYGNLTEGSVVKSYTLNGAASLTDYGTYDEVVNLTDGTAPALRDGAAEFRFAEGSAPERFYFEGKTAEPFRDLPWTISVSYALNGVAARAEDLAGKTGVVEISVEAIPNGSASEYARNNYTLEAMAMFNQDDILSLEAPGAQVQLVGNIRAVLFVALPGEENTFTVRVGCDDFSFGGWTFLMVPATLGQLEEVSKLSQRKDDLEEKYDKLSGSMDALLDSLAALSGDLRSTAAGLDELDQVRQSVSDGKDRVQESGDRALEDLKALAGSLSPFPGHMDGADSSVTEVTDALTRLTDTAVDIRKELDDISSCLKDLEDDLDDLIDGSGDVQNALDRVTADLKRLRSSTEALRGSLDILKVEVNGGIVGTMDPEVRKHIKVEGQSLEFIWNSCDMLNRLWSGVPKTDKKTSFDGFEQAVVTSAVMEQAKKNGQTLTDAQLAAAVSAQLTDMGAAVNGVNAQVAQAMTNAAAAGAPLTKEQALQTVLAAMKQGDGTAQAAAAAYEQYLVLQQVYTAVCGDPATASMTQEQFFTAMQMVQAIQTINSDAAYDTSEKKQQAIGKVLADKDTYGANAKLLLSLGDDTQISTQYIRGMLGDLASLLGSTGKLTGDLSDFLNELDSAMRSLTDTSSVARKLLEKTDAILAELKRFDDTVNAQIPGLREGLQDAKALFQDLTATAGDTHGFLSSARSLLRDNEDRLDAATKKSLESLASTLRKTAVSMDATGDVKTAKDVIDEIVTDTWDEYTGKVNNMLLMDATAQAESLTSKRNPSPASVQVLIRTQEIKAEEGEAASASPVQEQASTFWSRVGQMFRDLWNALTGWLR